MIMILISFSSFSIVGMWPKGLQIDTSRGITQLTFLQETLVFLGLSVCLCVSLSPSLLIFLLHPVDCFGVP